MKNTIIHKKTGFKINNVNGETLADKVNRLNDYLGNGSILENDVIRQFAELNGPFIQADFKEQ